MKLRLLSLAVVLGAWGNLAAQNPPMVTDEAVAIPSNRPEMLSVVPSFSVRDSAKAVAFYEKLGFAVVLRSGAYTAVGRDAVQIGLFQQRTTTQPKPGSLYIQMNRVDDFYAEVRQTGMKLTTELRTQPSKMREFSVTDPDNNTIVFGEYAGGR